MDQPRAQRPLGWTPPYPVTLMSNICPYMLVHVCYYIYVISPTKKQLFQLWLESRLEFWFLLTFEPVCVCFSEGGGSIRKCSFIFALILPGLNSSSVSGGTPCTSIPPLFTCFVIQNVICVFPHWDACGHLRYHTGELSRNIVSYMCWILYFIIRLGTLS